MKQCHTYLFNIETVFVVKIVTKSDLNYSLKLFVSCCKISDLYKFLGCAQLLKARQWTQAFLAGVHKVIEYKTIKWWRYVLRKAYCPSYFWQPVMIWHHWLFPWQLKFNPDLLPVHSTRRNPRESHTSLPVQLWNNADLQSHKRDVRSL